MSETSLKLILEHHKYLTLIAESLEESTYEEALIICLKHIQNNKIKNANKNLTIKKENTFFNNKIEQLLV